MFFRNQRPVGATLFVVLFATISGMVVGQSFGQTVTGTPGTALTNVVINFSNLATNPTVSVQGTNLTSSPPAITFEAQDDGGTQDPPFPGGAIGPNHVVSMLDNSIRIQKRDGTVISTITLQQFWGVLGPYVDTRGAFDGKVLYDPYKGRWITTAVADYDQPTSSTLIGVSQTSDPTGNWNLYRIAADTNGEYWVNYPSFGFNTNWVAVSVTAFTISSGVQESQLYVFDKANLYAGGSGNYTKFEFSSSNESTFGSVQLPAATYDSTQSNLYMLAEINGDSGGNGFLQMLFVTGAVGSEIVQIGPQISTPNPWDDTAPTFDFAPQLGTSQKIGLDDSRLGDTVYRNGAIWTAHTIFLPAGGAATRSALQWWQISTNGTVLQRGRLDDPTTNLFYGYPSIAVNQNNDALIGYARFSASNYPSAYFAFRAGTDPTNTLEGEVLLKAGETPFTRSDRWGDHTSTIVDPANDTDMWTIQEYSASPVKGLSLWGTWWGDVLVGSHVIAGNAVVLSGSCSPTNGVIDPFEQASVVFPLSNLGNENATNVTLTLLATGGVLDPSASQNLSVITSNNGPVATTTFSFLVDSSCGSNVVATLGLQSGATNLGTISYSLPVGVANGVFTQNFDSVVAPALPVNWSTTGSGALSGGWTTTNSNADTAPNAAFCPDTNNVGDARLVSPIISITSSNAQLIFRNNYDLELGYDGGILEIAVGTGTFQDVVTAGGSFEQGDYSHIISTNATGSTIIGSAAWSGNSGGWITTTVNLPAAAAGQNVQLRWRCVTDNSGGGNGWLIDGVVINDGGNCCTAGSEADLAISESASPSPVLVGSNLTYTITVTNIGPGIAFSTTVTDTPPSGVTFISATPSQGSCATDAFGNVICNLLNLTNGTTASISVLFSTVSTGSLTNILEVGAFSPDPNLANNTAANTNSAITAASFAVAPASHDFGAIVTGQTAQVSFVVTNQGEQTLTGTALVGGAPFAIASGTPFNVAGFGSTNVVVDFTPSSAGSFTDQVVFTSNGGGATNAVTGVGTIPAQLVVSPATLNFGALLVGQTSTQSFSVVNAGLTLLSGTATSGGIPFSIISGTPYNLSGGQTGTVNVAFAPGSVGTFSNSVVFASNGGNSTNSVIGSGAIVPFANFTGTPTTGIVSLAVTFTDTSTGTITNRSWTFGDGGTTNTLNTTVAYTYNSAGTDTVTLVVSGPLGVSTNSRLNYIVVTNGPPHLVVSPGNHDFGTQALGQSITQNFSVVNSGIQTLTGSATVSGVPFALISGSPYTLNSGQTGLVSVSFSPGTVGAFTGSVVFASNGGASTNALTGSGASAPIAGFTGSPTNGAATLVVTFTDASSGTVTGRAWSFGDGATSAVISPSHSYTTAGVFSVSLTVLGPLGSNTLPRANYITVTNVFAAPVAAFTASPLSGAAPLLVSFTDASTGTITNHSWVFGDGNTSIATSPSHTYSNAGVYPVSLTVLGPGGSSSTNRPGLITVTNALSVPPTVTIVRPGNGMLYPPSFTNQTITIVANATSNDGGTISMIEFFDGSTEIGSTNSSPGTNLLVHPALGVHVLSARASETFGDTNISVSVTITIGAKNSPLGDWEVQISGADKGAQFLTFADDYSATGFGIRLKEFGLEDVSGHWSFNAKGQETGPFLEQTDGATNWTGPYLGSAKSLKSISGSVPTASGTFHWKGVAATTFPDLSGTWTGLVTIAKTETPVSFVFTANTNDAAVFDIATSAAPSTDVGQLLVTSRNKVYGYAASGGKQINFSGTFDGKKSSLNLKGTDATAEKVTIELFQ